MTTPHDNRTPRLSFFFSPLVAAVAALGDPDAEPLIPGKLYVRLYHGRNSPNEQLNDWGCDSPTFGPLSGVVLTYATTIRLHAESHADELWLSVANDLIEWDGKFYGDWEVFIVPEVACGWRAREPLRL